MGEQTINIIVGKDGRITIPSIVRDVMGLKQGDVLQITFASDEMKIKLK